MTRYVDVPPHGRFPLPDDDPQTDAQFRERVGRFKEGERRERIARKLEKGSPKRWCQSDRRAARL